MELLMLMARMRSLRAPGFQKTLGWHVTEVRLTAVG
jgi:hypothetical protein